MRTPFRLSAFAVMILMSAMGGAGAETTTDRYGKELKIEPSHTIFARFGVLGLKMNNKSEAAKDVSGPVLSRPAVVPANDLSPKTITPGDRGWYCASSNTDNNGDPLARCDPAAGNTQFSTIYSPTHGGTEGVLFGNPSVAGTPANQGIDYLGLPENVKARFADPAPGAVGTIGMYFDDDQKWAVEVPVMALPFNVDVYGAGSFQQAGKIITAKALGFLVFGHYYFGNKADKFRPSVSLTANYLVPFNVRSTSALEQWTGGITKVSSKASLGLGWMLGGKYALNDRWDLNFNFGQFKAKIDSTLVTYDTVFTANSPIFTYWPGQLGDNLRTLKSQGILTEQLQGLRAYRNYDVANRVNGGANLGNFTRTQSQTLDPYVLMMTVGYNF